MRPTKVHHPIQVAIEDVYAAGHTPRLQIDARRRDVEVPDFIRRSWQARLVIDLDPTYPLDLKYGPDGIEVDLAFQGQVTRCRFAWSGVYAVIDRTTGRGIVVEGHLPAPELPLELAWEDRASKRPKLSAIPPPQNMNPRPSKTPVSNGEPPVEPAPPPPAAGTPSTLPVSSTGGMQPSPSMAPGGSNSDEEARARRARFRVIDGGR